MLATENSCTWLRCCQYQRKHSDWEFLINIFVLVNTENSSWWCWSWRWRWRWRWRWQWHYLDICQSKSHRGDCCHGDLSKIKSPHNYQLSEGKSRHLVVKHHQWNSFHKLQWYDKLKEPPSVEFLIFQLCPPLLPGFDPPLCLNRASDELSPKQIKL